MDDVNMQWSGKDKLSELRRALKQLKKQRLSSDWSIVRNWTEAAEVLGVSRMSMWRYRMELPAPPLPAFKTVIKRWAEGYGLPRKRGPSPSQR